MPSLIDAPVNADTSLEFYAATAEALHLWEPRFTLKNVRIASLTDGVLALNLTGEYLPDGKQITLEGVEVT